MIVLITAEQFHGHDPGRGHPERPARLDAVLAGLRHPDLVDATTTLAPRAATREEIELVHHAAYLDDLERRAARGGGVLDADTVMSSGSWDAALLAAGAGFTAVETLSSGAAEAAFVAVRPPGHHALPDRAMGFCLLNNVAITAAALAARGERVLIVDYDAHHGNGTQDTFFADGRVLYVSLHEWPLYPGTGRLDDVGTGAGLGTTCNLPLPAGATGDVYLRAIDEVVAPIVARFAPTWVLISAGYDAHRADPLTGLGLAAGDFADLTARIEQFAPGPGRTLIFLEGGYDLEALRQSASATLGALVRDEIATERSTSGGPGRTVVDAAADLWSRLG